jgi:hypothetical protein
LLRGDELGGGGLGESGRDGEDGGSDEGERAEVQAVSPDRPGVCSVFGLVVWWSGGLEIV